MWGVGLMQSSRSEMEVNATAHIAGNMRFLGRKGVSMETLENPLELLLVGSHYFT